MAEDEQGQKKQTVRINLPPKQTSTATVKVAGPPAKKAATKAAAAPASKAASAAGGAATGAPARRPVARRQAAPAASGMDVALAVITLALCAVTCVQLALIVLKGAQS